MSWNYSGYGGQESNYPPNSGPPPPPPGGIFGQNAASANANYPNYDPGFGYGNQQNIGFNTFNAPASGGVPYSGMVGGYPSVPSYDQSAPIGFGFTASDPSVLYGSNVVPPSYGNQMGGYDAFNQQHPSYGANMPSAPPTSYPMAPGPPQMPSGPHSSYQMPPISNPMPQGVPQMPLNSYQPPPASNQMPPASYQPPPASNQPPPASNQVPSAPYVPNQMQSAANDQQQEMLRMQQEMARMVLEVQRMKQQPNDPNPQQPLRPDQISGDANLKAQIKRMFVDELLRRQAVSGTFDITEGTVKPLVNYPASDPVVVFYSKERSTDLSGKPWDVEADCEYLRKAMKGMGTDEDAIIHVVVTRCNAQRQRMKDMFKTMYGKDLISDLKSELSGDFREAVMACFVKPAVFDAWSVKEAIYGLGTDERALIEIFMTRTNAQIKEMAEVYPDVANPSKKGGLKSMLEKDIQGDTSGNFKKLLISACQGNRFEITRERLEAAVEEKMIDGRGTGIFDINFTKLVDMNKVQQDADRLFKAGEARWGTNEDEFNLIFSTRDYYHLREVYNAYVKIAQRDILNSIDRETSGDTKLSLRAVVMNIRNRPGFFAHRLFACMKGVGTDEKTLIRIIVSRSEIDLVQIKKCFLEETKKTLWRWLKDDTSGDFRKILQAIVGKD